MKLTEVRKFVDAICADPPGSEHEMCMVEFREALAKAFVAGVRSTGLRFQKDAALLAACGCEPEAKQESK